MAMWQRICIFEDVFYLKFVKALGRFAVYALFFACTWIFNILICGIIGSLYYDGVDEFTGKIYSISMLFLPAIASTLETRAFSKKWAQKRRSQYSSYVVSNEKAKGCKSVSYVNSPSPHPARINANLVNFLVSYFSQFSSVQTSSLTTAESFAKYGGVDAELLTIDLLEGHDFEYWCANALRDMEFTDVEVTPGSGDQGVDVLASKDGVKYAIQCKRYTSDLGNSPVQEVHAGKNIYHCHVGAVVTNRYFTRGAKELAEATGVLLWDRDWIKQYLSTKASDDGSIDIQHAQQSVPSLVSEIGSSHDELLPAAIEVILETEQASVSMIQRRLVLGYARAARIMDEMESIGVVGPFQGNCPREIYITRAEWNAVLNTIQH